MSDKKPKLPDVKGENSLPGWVDHLSLPSVVAGPAGRALSRLIGAAAEVPAAYLEGYAQSVRADFEARAHLKRSMSEAAVQKYTADPEILDRFGRRWLSDEIVRQGNRETIAHMAAKELEEKSQDEVSIDEAQEVSDVSDDWLRVFGENAQDVSDEFFQGIWAKVLSGEIRKPGTVAKSLLRLIPEIEKEDIGVIEEYGRLIIGQNFIPIDGGQPVLIVSRLEELGLIQGSGLGFTKSIPLQDNGVGYIDMGDCALVFTGEKGNAWSVPGVIATRKYRDLCSVLSYEPGESEAKKISDILIKQQWVKSVFYAKKYPIEGNRIRFEPIHIYKNPDSLVEFSSGADFSFGLND